jgi:polysaccharide pyruvyl transferase WcaK-like protein
MPIRIALWGGASLCNVGDQMLFDAVETGLGQRLPGAEFTRFCPWAADDGPVRPLWVSPSGRWPGAISSAAGSSGAGSSGAGSSGAGSSGAGSFDAVVIVGGVFAGPPFANVLMQAFTLGSVPAAFDPGVLAAWYGVGLDDTTRPPSKPEWHDYLRALGKRLDFATVRAPSAADRFRQAGAPVPRVVPDPAFGLPARAAARRLAHDGSAARGGRRPRIGVAVGEAVASSRLVGLFTDMRIVLRYVRESGFDRTTCLDAVEIAGREFAAGELDPKRAFSTRLAAELAGLQRIGTVEFIAVDNMYDDAAASAAFAGALGGAPVRRLRQADAAGLGDAFGRYDLVVVSRFHSVVLAMQAGVPFIAADPYWHPDTGTSKVRQLLAAVGRADRHWAGPHAQASLGELAEAALGRGDADRHCYLAQHARAGQVLDELATAISRAR